jgi:hypothetical protein
MAPPCGCLEKKTHTASPVDQIRSRLGARGRTGRLNLMREVHATNQTAGHRGSAAGWQTQIDAQMGW